MVGSRDFDDDSIDGQVNVALTPQQPGSSIKPFTYIAAFRKGWTPATVIWDVPIEYEIPGFGVYAPVNYDETFRGPVTVREAIANSLNVPAVQTLDYAGVPALLEVLNDVVCCRDISWFISATRLVNIVSAAAALRCMFSNTLDSPSVETISTVTGRF